MAHRRFTIPELDRAGLRKFGITTGAIVAVVFGGIIPVVFGMRSPLWPWVVGGVLLVWAFALPQTLVWVYRPWMIFGHQMSRVTTPVFLGLVFFIAFTPVSLMRSLRRVDAMQRRLDAKATTYRTISRKPSVENLERPY